MKDLFDKRKVKAMYKKNRESKKRSKAMLGYLNLGTWSKESKNEDLEYLNNYMSYV